MQLHTKKDFQDMLEKICEPTFKYFSEGGAEVCFGHTSALYSDKIARFEGFSRILWGLTPLWAGGKDWVKFEEVYIKGMINGTNPEHPEYWGIITGTDQRMVEMCAMAYNFLLVPEKILDKLSEKEKDNLAAWLYQINENPLAHNNWLFFNVFTNLALKKMGRKYSQERLDFDFESIEAFYLSNGWYKDGLDNQMDYYIPFAMQFYGLVYSVIMEKEDPERSLKYKERAKSFAKSFIHFFDSDGAAIPFGRSMTYRYAQSCFWSACVYAGIDVFDLGTIKGILTRNLKYWLESNINDNDGILTIGYKYPNLNMAEGYNAPGSPYWALKTMLFLALPDSHEFWKVEAKELPKLDKKMELPEAKMILQHTGNHAVILTSGQFAGFIPVHVAEKYSKFAYSSKFGFSVPRSYLGINKTAADSMLTFEIDGICFVRRECLDDKIERGIIYSKWKAFTGLNIETEIIPTKDGHIRKHIINSEYDCVAYDSGFALSLEEEKLEIIEKANIAKIINKTGYCEVSGMGEGVVLRVEANTNLINSRTAIPAIKYIIKKGKNIIETGVKYEC